MRHVSVGGHEGPRRAGAGEGRHPALPGGGADGPQHGRYVAAVVKSDVRNLRAGYLLPGDARQNRIDAVHSDVGRG